MGAWGVACSRVLLVPLYIRVIALSVTKLWAQGVNESYLTKWPLVPLGLSLRVFIVRGLSWGVDLLLLV